jgi:hypothetical protein
VPCLIRRSAFERAWGRDADPTGYRLQDLRAKPLDATKGKQGTQIRAFQYAIRRLEDRPGLARLLVHKPGPLREVADRLDGLAGVYARGMNEVGTFLEGVETYSSAVAEVR